jgi:hypothetical protein
MGHSLTRGRSSFAHYAPWPYSVRDVDAQLPLWCVFPITVTVAAGYVLLEFTQFALLARRQYMLAGLAHILKWLIFPILSYIWRLYDERLLRYAWIRWIYGLYMFAWGGCTGKSGTVERTSSRTAM